MAWNFETERYIYFSQYIRLEAKSQKDASNTFSFAPSGGKCQLVLFDIDTHRDHDLSFINLFNWAKTHQDQ